MSKLYTLLNTLISKVNSCVKTTTQTLTPSQKSQARANIGAMADTYTAPVTSVNGQTGDVTLDAAAVGARPSSWTPTAANVGAVPASRKVNGKALSADITLSAADVSAVATSSALTVTGIDADGVSHSWTMYGVAQ